MRRTSLVPHRFVAILALVSGLAVAAPASAQDTTSTANARPTAEGSIAVLTLRDGSVLQGRVLEVTPTHVRFASSLGETLVLRTSIRELRVASGEQVRDGEVWPEDPSRTRLFFAPTGRTLRQSEAYFADAYIFFPSFQIGVSNSFSLGAGMSIFPGVGLDNQIYYLTPKLGVFASPRLNVSVGALVAGAALVSDNSPFGIGYGVATFGGEHSNFTAGGGLAYSRDAVASTSPLLMGGGVVRTSRNIALVSENYLLLGDDAIGLFSGGVRFIGERLSVDLAGFFASGSSTPVPYVAFIYRLP